MNYLIEGDTGIEQQTGRSDNTSNEISDQPELWRQPLNKLSKQKDSIKCFIDAACQHQDLSIIITGAGTSAFIGESLAGSYRKGLGKCTQAVLTTDFVFHPESFFQKEAPPLMESFARSGSSPESTAAVILGDLLCNKIYYLIITCNASGELAAYAKDEVSFFFLLPPQSKNLGLAMTGKLHLNAFGGTSHGTD